MSSIDELPSGWSSLWRMCRFAYRQEPMLGVAALLMSLAAAFPDALLALWLKFLGQGVLQHNQTLLVVASMGLAISACATWLLRTVSTRVQRHFRDKLTISLEGHVAGLQARISTVAHHERSEYLDRLSVLRDQTFVLDHMFMSFFSSCGWILRLAITIALLASISPALILLAVFALPVAGIAAWRPKAERCVQEESAQCQRLAKHLFTLLTTASPAKEVRILGIGENLASRRRSSWEQAYRPIARARTVTALFNSFSWLVFGLGYVGAIVFVTSVLHSGPAPVLLVLAAGSRLSGYVSGTVSEVSFLTGVWLDGSRRLAWLEDYAAAVQIGSTVDPPGRLEYGIVFEEVSFVYPGASWPALEFVDLEIPAGSVVAIVGENGAGKSTLVKLLARMYDPTSGSILIDEVPLSSIKPETWRERLSGAFQDFYKFEFTAQLTVGLGDVPRSGEAEPVLQSVARAGAGELIESLPGRLSTQLGASWPSGVDLSFGQWQKLALARAFMRERPLLLVLDEPTAALDAETEHALFEGFAAAARAGSSEVADMITILVSHRFSTVRMADLIIVMDGSRVVEFGSHEELMRTRGKYAQLYDIQAAAYTA